MAQSFFRRALRWTTASFAMLGVAVAAFAAKEVIKEPTTVSNPEASPLQFTMKDIDGKDVNLADWKGKVLLFVNVASRCGNTPQYDQLEAIFEKYKDNGLVVVGFPANNFGSQEPGSEQQIKEFCTSKYNVTFQMMSKISVKGSDKHPLYKFLTEAPTAGEFGGEVEWNFGKFLIDRNGNVIARFPASMKPDNAKVVTTIEKALAAPAAPVQE